MTATRKFYLGMLCIAIVFALMWTTVGVLFCSGRLERPDAVVWAVFLGLAMLAALVAILRRRSPADMQAWDAFLLGYDVVDFDRVPEELKSSYLLSRRGTMSKACRNRRPGGVPCYVGEVTFDERHFDGTSQAMGLSSAFTFFAAKRRLQSNAHALGVSRKNALASLFVMVAEGSARVREQEGIQLVVFGDGFDADTESALLRDLRRLDPGSSLIECVGEWMVVYSTSVPTVANAQQICTLMENHAS